jgi:methyl coenzyme M reductase subunit D
MTAPNAAVAGSYSPSPIKRHRATKAETDTRRRRILEIVEEDHPMTVRQVYYRAVVLNLIGKTEQDYDKIQNDLTELRRAEKLPYDWLVDEGRFPRQPYTVEGIVEALNNTRRHYRKDPWQGIDEYVQIWV